MALLFGPRGGQGRSQPKNIVEFRAGKMTLKGKLISLIVHLSQFNLISRLQCYTLNDR